MLCPQPPCSGSGNHVPCYIRSQVSEAGALGGTCSCMRPCLQESHVGSKSLMGPTSPGPTSALIHVGSRARSPERPNAKNLEGESSHQALKSCAESPHIKRATSLYVLQRTIQHSWSQLSSMYISCVCAWPGLAGPCMSINFPTLFSRKISRQTDLMADSSADLL